MRPRLLVVRSGERPFPSALVPELDVLERVTHTIETLTPAAELVGGPFDLVIVTSRAAAERLLAREDLVGRVSGRVIAVGPATARLLRPSFPEVEEGGGSARLVLRSLPGALAGARVLLPRGEDARPELPIGLAARGAEVVPLDLYRKTARPYDLALESIVAAGSLAALCATSPSAAAWLFEGASEDLRVRLRGTPAIALGGSTAQALTARGVARVAEARPPTFETAARMGAEIAARAARA